MTIPANNKSQASGVTKNHRPISLLASISDFDRQAAKIVEQRNEEKRKRVNDESFYVVKESQNAIDEIMANVEQKMECLDAIGKHNNRWEKRISHDSVPPIDMHGLVSDLNQFLTTTKKEMMTPRTKRKQEIMEAKKQVMKEEEDRKQAVQKEIQEVDKLVDECKQIIEQELSSQPIQKKQKCKQKETPDKQAKQEKCKQIEAPDCKQEKCKQIETPEKNGKQLVSDATKGAISKVKNTELRRKQQKVNNYEETWSCSKCTLINSTKNQICILCGASSKPLAKAIEEPNDHTIFAPREDTDEDMPAKGNVLDRVVQFTAMQMWATDRPASVMTSRSSTNFEDLEIADRPVSAMNSRPVSSHPVFTPTPIVHRVHENNQQTYEQKRLSVLEKEETTEILARWKKEHEEREKARREFFKPIQQKDSVLETQAALLNQARKNLDKTEDASKKMSKVKNEKTKEVPSKLFGQGVSKTPSTESKRRQEPVKDEVKKVSKTENRHQEMVVAKAKDEVKKERIITKSSSRFDPSKTPSSFISQKESSQPPSNAQEIIKAEVVTPENDAESDMTREALRKKRLEYFESTVHSPPATLKTREFERDKSEVKKIIELEEKLGHYDVPMSPPKRVPESFFEQLRKSKKPSEKPAQKKQDMLIKQQKPLEKSPKNAKIVKTQQNKKQQQQNSKKQSKPIERLEIKSLKLSGQQANPAPQRPARNKNRKSVLSTAENTPAPTPLPAERPRIITTRKVDEIDDLVTKKVDKYEPPVTPLENKLPSKMTGAIPKSQLLPKIQSPKKTEIVDDVLYIAGPVLKKEVKRETRKNSDEPLAFPLIPLEKFDPANTLTRKSSKQSKKQQERRNVNNSNQKAGGQKRSNNKQRKSNVQSQLQQMGNPNEIHAEATIQPPSSEFTSIYSSYIMCTPF